MACLCEYLNISIYKNCNSSPLNLLYQYNWSCLFIINDIKQFTYINYDILFQCVAVCAQLYKGITMILDMTWTGWDKLRDLARDFGIIYKRGDTTISAYVQALDDIMMYKNATDAALIFENEKGM